MRRRDIRAARRVAVAHDWAAAANDERDEFDYQVPAGIHEPNTADSYQRDAIASAQHDDEPASVDAAGHYTD